MFHPWICSSRQQYFFDGLALYKYAPHRLFTWRANYFPLVYISFEFFRAWRPLHQVLRLFKVIIISVVCFDGLILYSYVRLFINIIFLYFFRARRPPHQVLLAQDSHVPPVDFVESATTHPRSSQTFDRRYTADEATDAQDFARGSPPAWRHCVGQVRSLPFFWQLFHMLYAAMMLSLSVLRCYVYHHCEFIDFVRWILSRLINFQNNYRYPALTSARQRVFFFGGIVVTPHFALLHSSHHPAMCWHRARPWLKLMCWRAARDTCRSVSIQSETRNKLYGCHFLCNWKLLLYVLQVRSKRAFLVYVATKAPKCFSAAFVYINRSARLAKMPKTKKCSPHWFTFSLSMQLLQMLSVSSTQR